MTLVFSRIILQSPLIDISDLVSFHTLNIADWKLSEELVLTQVCTTEYESECETVQHPHDVEVSHVITASPSSYSLKCYT